MKLRTVIFILALALPAAAAVAGKDPIANPNCPVMTDQEALEDLFVEYRGVRVHFCCEDCVDDFRADPEEYVPNLPPAMVAAMIPLSEWQSKEGAGATPPSPGADEEHPLGVLHPILVHFPLALTAVAALAVLLSLFVARSFYRNTATFLIVLAALSVVPTYLTGGEAEEAKGVMSDAMHERVETHEETALVALCIVVAAAVAQVVSYVGPLRKPLGWISFVLILSACAVAAYTGYLGGEVNHPDHLKHLLPF